MTDINCLLQLRFGPETLFLSVSAKGAPQMTPSALLAKGHIVLNAQVKSIRDQYHSKQTMSDVRLVQRVHRK